MRKKLWLNLALLLLVVGLVLLLMINNKSEQAQHNAGKSMRLFDTLAQDVQRIVIERQGKQTVVLQKKQQYWLLAKPALAALSEQRIQHLLTIVEEPIQGKLARQEGDLARFQLDAEQIKLTINDEKITFGMINPVTKNRYVLKNGSIYMIKEIVYGTLGSSVTQLLQHRLLPRHLQVTQIEAPASFYTTATTYEAWHTVEATNIADYSDNETILGIVSLTLQSHKQQNNNNDNKQVTLTTLVFDILAIKPTLILGRADLQVKYTIDKETARGLLAIE